MYEKKVENIIANYTSKNAILVGNGINLLAENVSWETFSTNIKDQFRVDVHINRNKSFPLETLSWKLRCLDQI
jgi:hypothetical protein